MNQLHMINRMLMGGAPPYPPFLDTETSLWLKADNPLNTNIRWYDASPNNHILNGTASLTDSVLNGQKGYVFNGSSDFFDGGDILDLRLHSMTIYTIHKGSSSFISPISKYGNNSTGEWYVEWWSARGYQTGVYNPNQINVTLASLIPSTFVKKIDIFDRTNGVIISQHLTKSAQVAFANNSTDLNTSTPLIIGSVGSYRMNGTICEIIVFDRLLTTVENTEVNAYLNTKYGL